MTDLGSHTSSFPIHWFGHFKDKATSKRYHLTPDECIGRLQSIIENGFRFGHCTEKFKLPKNLRRKLLIPEHVDFMQTAHDIICFSDIPLNLSEEHSKKYGSCGIGLVRDCLIANGGQPVIYRSGHDMDKLLHQQIQLWQILNPGQIEELKKVRDEIQKIDLLWSFLSDFLTELQFNTKMMDHENGQVCGNYLEREWRIVSQPGVHGSHVKFQAGDIETLIIPKFLDTDFEKVLKKNKVISNFFDGNWPSIVEEPVSLPLLV